MIFTTFNNKLLHLSSIKDYIRFYEDFKKDITSLQFNITAYPRHLIEDSSFSGLMLTDDDAAAQHAALHTSP